MKSMTGYGSAKGLVDGGIFTVDIRTLNHRYCEIVIRLPQTLASLEPLIRQQVTKKFARGRIEINVNEEIAPKSSKKFILDKTLASEHKRLITNLAKQWGVESGKLLSKVDPCAYIVPVTAAVSPAKWWKNVKPLLDKACNQVVSMRAREGKALNKDQRNRIKKMNLFVKKLQKISTDAMNAKRKSLQNKLGSIGADKSQINQEELNLVNRHDVSEELTRFSSHLGQYLRLLSSEVVGRKLDFLLQEMNREITTFGAKVCDGKASQIVVDGKAEIERLREQAQNIE